MPANTLRRCRRYSRSTLDVETSATSIRQNYSARVTARSARTRAIEVCCNAWTMRAATQVDQVLAEVDAAADEIVAFTSALIRMPTVNPPGEAYEDCARLL